MMKECKGKVENAKDKIAGKAKEAIGKATDNEQLELKGKIQSSKSDLNNKSQELKESIAGKINDFVDKKKANKEEK